MNVTKSFSYNFKSQSVVVNVKVHLLRLHLKSNLHQLQAHITPVQSHIILSIALHSFHL